MLGTVTGKIINGGTLANMRLIKPEAIIKLEGIKNFLKSDGRISPNFEARSFGCSTILHT